MKILKFHHFFGSQIFVQWMWTQTHFWNRSRISVHSMTVQRKQIVSFQSVFGVSGIRGMAIIESVI